MKKYGTHFCRLQKQSNTLLSAIKDTSVIFAGTHSADPNVFVEVGFFSCELLPWTIFFKAGTLDPRLRSDYKLSDSVVFIMDFYIMLC